MAILRATISLADVTGLDANRFVNVWHFESADAPADAAAAIVTFLPVVYQNTTLAALFAETVSRVALAHRIVVAEVTEGAAGSGDDVISRPLQESTFTISTAETAASSPLPHEVALCLSFQGNISGIPEETGNTRPANRRRGRVFMGPFNHTATNSNGAFGARPTDALRNAMIDAYQAPIASLKTVSPPVNHVVYSPTSGNAFVVTRVSVDDSWDTIRSRGTPPTNKISEVVP